MAALQLPKEAAMLQILFIIAVLYLGFVTPPVVVTELM